MIAARAAAAVIHDGELSMESVVAGYHSGHPVLRGVTLRAKANAMTVILGPNGAGKSTVLKVLAGFLPTKSGRIAAGGADITHLPAHRHLAIGIGLLPQGRSVFPELTVAENIELGGWLWRSDRARLRQAVARVLERYPLLAEMRAKPAGSLSGGQQRSLEIARLMVTDPHTLLIDEPSAGLSPKLAADVYRDLVALKNEGRTILLVDQDVRAAIAIADYVYVLNSGRNDIEGDRSAFQGDLGAMVRGWLGV